MNEIPGLLLFSLILMRMSGFIIFNPVLGRRNIPALVKAGIIMVLSVNLFAHGSAEIADVIITNSVAYSILLLKEFAIGYLLGFTMDLFFYVASYAGSFIDFNVGMSMANVFDAQSNASIPLTGSVFSTMMTMLFFAVDGHLALIKILMQSSQIVPYGEITVSPQAITTVLSIFQECTLLAAKLAFPFFALELLAEAGVGVLMKVVPQINVLIVNIEVKVLVGNLLMLLLCIPVGNYLDDVIIRMIDVLQMMLRMI